MALLTALPGDYDPPAYPGFFCLGFVPAPEVEGSVSGGGVFIVLPRKKKPIPQPIEAILALILAEDD